MIQPCPAPIPRAYHCLPCDVYGRGDECWLCGSERVLFGRMPPTNCGAPGPDFSGSQPEPQSSLLIDWSTPLVDPMALYAEGHVPSP